MNFNAGGLKIHQGARQARLAPAYGCQPRNISYEYHEWIPSTELAPDPSSGFTIPLACWTGPDGLRRWFLEDLITHKRSLDAVIGCLFDGGLEILWRVNNRSGQPVCSHRQMYLLFSRRSAFTEYYKRKFHWSRDLFIRRTGRLTNSQTNPTQPVDRQAERDASTVLSVVKPGLSVKGFMRMARREAKGRGLEDPPKAKLVQIGLHKIAREQPLQLPPDQVPAVVRRALFNLDMQDADIDAIQDHPFVERLLEAIESHLHDTEEKFRAWFVEQLIGKSFAHLARRKWAKGGPITPEQAREIVLALVWRAHKYVGDCVHSQMQVIRNGMGSLMSPDEKEIFDRMYLNQDVFGGLPWLLLKERWHLLAPEICEWMDDPKKQLDFGVVHRLLQMYGLMMTERQRADKQSKRASSAAMDQFEYQDDRDATQVAVRECSKMEEAMVRAILEMDKVRCPTCGGAGLKLVRHNEPNKESVCLDLVCQACRGTLTHSCTKERAEQAVK